MKKIDTGYCDVTFLDDKLLVIEARDGVEITADVSSRGYDAIEKEMPGDYGVIIDRIKDYSIAPVEVYDIMNRRQRLRAVALVAHRQTTVRSAEMERRLSIKPLECFLNLEDAVSWIRTQVN